MGWDKPSPKYDKQANYVVIIIIVILWAIINCSQNFLCPTLEYKLTFASFFIAIFLWIQIIINQRIGCFPIPQHLLKPSYNRVTFICIALIHVISCHAPTCSAMSFFTVSSSSSTALHSTCVAAYLGHLQRIPLHPQVVFWNACASVSAIHKSSPSSCLAAWFGAAWPGHPYNVMAWQWVTDRQTDGRTPTDEDTERTIQFERRV